VFKINKGKKPAAIRFGIYGVESVGKSTIISKLDEVLFIDTEDGTFQLDVNRFDRPKNWAELKEMISYVRDNPTICKTLAIDTLDRAEKLLIDDMLQKDGKQSLSDYAYGKGVDTEAQRWQKEFLFLLDEVIAKGINVAVTSHAVQRKIENPDESSYDHWEMSLTKKTGPLTKQWLDALFFATFDTNIIEDENGHRRATGKPKRMLYCNHSASFDAKNRFGLADSYPLSPEPIKQILQAERKLEKDFIDLNNPQTGIVDGTLTETVYEALKRMLEQNGISIDQANTYEQKHGKPVLEEDSENHIKSIIDHIDLFIEEVKKEGEN